MAQEDSGRSVGSWGSSWKGGKEKAEAVSRKVNLGMNLFMMREKEGGRLRRK